jgi:hypothetical protein
VIWLAYCGYCWAVAAAPANDLVSWSCTVVLICCWFGAAAIAAPMAEA